MAKKAKAKKRGVKPGSKRGRYTKNKTTAALDKLLKNPSVLEYVAATPLTLCGQLEDAVMLLETRISNVIAKINSLM